MTYTDRYFYGSLILGLILFAMMFMSCATTGSIYGPADYPAAKEKCVEMCKEHGREYDNLRMTGHCVCKPAPRMFKQ